VTFRQQLMSSSNCCLLSSARGHHREQQIVVNVAQLVGPPRLCLWHLDSPVGSWLPRESTLRCKNVFHLLISGRVLYVSTHTQRRETYWFLEQATSQFIQPNQTAPTSTQWNTRSVASPYSMSTSPVCSKYQWTEAVCYLLRNLVWHGTAHHWQCN